MRDYVIHGPHGKTVAFAGLFGYSLEKRRVAFVILNQLRKLMREGETLTRCTISFDAENVFVVTTANIQGHSYGITIRQKAVEG